MGGFFLQLMVAEEELTIHLLVDNSASMNWGNPNKFLYARRAAAVGYIALSTLDRVTVSGLAGRGQQLPSVRGKRGALPLFDFMQKLQPGAGQPARGRPPLRADHARNVGPLLLCSDLMDPAWQDTLRTLTSRPFEITVHTLAPAGAAPRFGRRLPAARRRGRRADRGDRRP